MRAWRNDSGRRFEFNSFRPVEADDLDVRAGAEKDGGVLVRKSADGGGGHDLVGVTLLPEIVRNLCAGCARRRIDTGGGKQPADVADGRVRIARRFDGLQGSGV